MTATPSDQHRVALAGGAASVRTGRDIVSDVNFLPQSPRPRLASWRTRNVSHARPGPYPLSRRRLARTKTRSNPPLLPRHLRYLRAALRGDGHGRSLLPARRSAAAPAHLLSRAHGDIFHQQADAGQGHRPAGGAAVRVSLCHRRGRDELGRPERAELRLAAGGRSVRVSGEGSPGSG